MKKRRPVLLPALALLIALPAYADRYPVPKNAPYQEECASCHMAYPPQLLDANSWRAVMNGLPKHFGTDASVDEKHRVPIVDFLTRNAGGGKIGVTVDASGKPLLRISETARFVRKHRELSAATFKRASIKSPANCGACHTGAAEGDYNDDHVRIPK
jgi:hypothetical protein